MAADSAHVFLKFAVPNEAPVDQLPANVVDKVEQDWSPVMARRVDVSNRIHANVR
jgi:hypothetical protein